ncbi:hypothetical protein AB0B56_36340 [Streptosporangium canum]|uniref:hypothetical protein n=1 Tax=Streptosporangium canum TaxID=324952 RepID=UPI003433BEC8
MWFLDRTARQLRRHPALLTHRPPDLDRLEALLRRYDPGLTRSGDWFDARGTRVRCTEITDRQAALAGVPADRRGAIIARNGLRPAARLLLNGLASRLGGALYPPQEHDDHVDVEVRLGRGLPLGCERVAELLRPNLGERTIRHDHDLGLCHIDGKPGDPIQVTYDYPPPGWPGDLPDHSVDLEIDGDDPHRSDVEVVYKAARSLAAAVGGTVYSMDLPVTRVEDVIPTADRLDPPPRAQRRGLVRRVATADSGSSGQGCLG